MSSGIQTRHAGTANPLPLSGHGVLDRIKEPVNCRLQAFEDRLAKAVVSDVGMVQAMADHLNGSRGNRIRPILALLTAEAVGGCADRAVEAAVGIELLHTATLIHDDVVDSADKRRGLDVLSIRWGNLAAVLMGDFLFANALRILVELDSTSVMRAAARTVKHLTEGEILEAERSGDGDSAVYFRIIERKTASLMALSCETGAVLGGGTEEQVVNMTSFGKNLGMAFQMTDDLLDFTGDESMMGKPAGQDMREGKITLPLIRALANCRNGEAGTIRKKLQRGLLADEEVLEIVDFVRRYRGFEEAREEAKTYAVAGLGHLYLLNPSPARDALELAVQHVMERKR